MAAFDHSAPEPPYRSQVVTVGAGAAALAGGAWQGRVTTMTTPWSAFASHSRETL
jgi:hypothetical protein